MSGKGAWLVLCIYSRMSPGDLSKSLGSWYGLSHLQLAKARSLNQGCPSLHY
jgi:hypothetical protein